MPEEYQIIKDSKGGTYLYEDGKLISIDGVSVDQPEENPEATEAPKSEDITNAD